MINSLPYSSALRIIRICSTPSRCRFRLNELKKFFILRKYPLRLINNAISKALSHQRSVLLSNTSESVSKIPFITPFIPGIQPTLKSTVFNNVPILRRSNTMDSILTSNTPTLAFQRTRNLRDLLVKAEFNHSRPPLGFTTCDLTSCPLHSHSSNSRQFSSSVGNTYRIKSHITCATTNAIYLITCLNCQQQYVGETGRSVRTRLKEHVASIRRKTNSPVALHFNSDSHDLSHFSFLGIESLHNHSLFYRRLREAFWIHKLDTLNMGMNNYLSDELLQLAAMLDDSVQGS